MKLELLKTGHYGLNGEPVYLYVRRHRESYGLSKSVFAKRHGIDHSAQYRFETSQNRSFQFAVKQLEALGLTVTITVE